MDNRLILAGTISETNESHDYLLPCLRKLIRKRIREPKQRKLIDIGCGNGAVTNILRLTGFEVVGVDPSQDGIDQARAAFPDLHAEVGSAYDDLPSSFGTFDVVICLEVVEHLYFPSMLARNIRLLLRPGGFAILSTPYHGYLKNVALSAAGKWDVHHHPLVDHGHIKFWSKSTLEQLMVVEGMKAKEFYRLGRIPALAKSMMVVFEQIWSCLRHLAV